MWRHSQKGGRSAGNEESETLKQGCQTHFHGGHISLTVAFKGPNVMLGLCKYNYSLTRGKELGIAAG